MVNPAPLATPTEAPSRPTGAGMAIAGMVLGILAIVLCWVVIFDWIIAILGIIFSAIGVSKANKGAPGKGMAIAGLACGIVGFLLSTVILIVAMAVAEKQHSDRFGSVTAAHVDRA